MDITLLPVIGLGLLMEQGMDVDCVLSYAASAGTSSRWNVLDKGTVDMERTA